MKRIYLLVVICLLLVTSLLAQTPQAFKYQAVARDNQGNVLTDKDVSLKIELLVGTSDGQVVFSEKHNVTTNSFGLITLEIGNGADKTGNISELIWSENSYFLRLWMDIEGGTNYEELGSSRLFAVPYAFYAEKSGDSSARLDYWLGFASDIYYNLGNVGIGTNQPSEHLEVIGNVKAHNFFGNFVGDGSGLTGVGKWSGDDDIYFNEGFVGIGDTNPQAMLHVKNDTTKSDLIFEGYSADGAAGQLRLINQFNGDLFNISLRRKFGNTEIIQSAFNSSKGTWYAFMHFNLNTTEYQVRNGIGTYRFLNSQDVLFDNTGNVGVGVASPTEKMEVDGNIKSIGKLISGNSIEIDGTGGTEGVITESHGKISFDDETVYTQGQVGVGTSEPNAAAALEISSTTQGFLPPVMNTLQRDAIVNPPAGLVIYNTDHKALELFDGITWGSVTGEFICGITQVQDAEGNIYNTVEIAGRCWLDRNMNIGVMIPSTNPQLDNSLFEKYCYNDEADSCDVYGGLYQWNEMMEYGICPGEQGICPDGWHIPMEVEMDLLGLSIGCSAGGQLKEVGTDHWMTPNTGANNNTGFTGLPAGIYDADISAFSGVKEIGRFWTSSVLLIHMKPLYRELRYDSESTFIGLDLFESAKSVRCIKDCH